MNWYTSWRRTRKQQKLLRAKRELRNVTEAIQGIDEEIWPEAAEWLREDRTRLAWLISDLTRQLGGLT